MLVQLRNQFMQLPKRINWQINAPNNVRDLINQSQNVQHKILLPGELGSSEKCNLLEAINLSLFNLNNEEIDLNLRTTGTQLIILSAGYGTYRIN